MAKPQEADREFVPFPLFFSHRHTQCLDTAELVLYGSVITLNDCSLGLVSGYG